jgi:hypothetical protein
MRVTPHSDAAIEQIALYLKDGLNGLYQGSVANCSAVDQVPSDPSAYPHLCVHRTEAEGEALQVCRGIVRYLMLSPADKAELPGQFRTMQLAIVELLRQFDDPQFNVQILRPQSFRCRERLLGLQNGLIPFFELEFLFVDFCIR